MKPLFISMLLAGLATLWLSSLAEARPHDAGVDARQHHQQQRIGRSMCPGALTAGETRRLECEQRHIRQEERRDMSDGQLGRAGRAELHRDQNRAGRHSWQEKHDARRGGWQNSSASRDPGVNARPSLQHERIQDGWRDGSLARAERRDLQQDLEAASQHIDQERHDAG